MQSKNVGPLVANLNPVQGPSKSGALWHCTSYTLRKLAHRGRHWGGFSGEPGICFSNKFPGDANTVSLRVTTLTQGPTDDPNAGAICLFGQVVT